MALKVGEYTEDGRKVLDSIDGIPIYSRRRYTPEEIAAEKKGAAEPPAKPKPKKKARPETTTRSGRNSATEKPAKSKTKAPKKETKTTVKTKKKAPKKSKPAPATRPRTKSATKKATPKKAKSTNGPTVDYGLKCCCGCGTPVARRNLFARGHVSRIFKLYGSNPQHVLKIAKEVKRRTEEATKHSRKNGGKK